jgi:hypothetical protein
VHKLKKIDDFYSSMSRCESRLIFEIRNEALIIYSSTYPVIELLVGGIYEFPLPIEELQDI